MTAGNRVTGGGWGRPGKLDSSHPSHLSLGLATPNRKRREHPNADGEDARTETETTHKSTITNNLEEKDKEHIYMKKKD